MCHDILFLGITLLSESSGHLKCASRCSFNTEETFHDRYCPTFMLCHWGLSCTPSHGDSLLPLPLFQHLKFFYLCLLPRVHVYQSIRSSSKWSIHPLFFTLLRTTLVMFCLSLSSSFCFHIELSSSVSPIFWYLSAKPETNQAYKASYSCFTASKCNHKYNCVPVTAPNSTLVLRFRTV